MANNYFDWTEEQLNEYESDLVRAVATAQKHLDAFRAVRHGQRPAAPPADNGNKEKQGAAA
ncbi:MAG: hypothetical protein A3J09_00835 [Candidatus Zambryskibacteria bacterium RIFCSPLOWO2_02_FULL_51_21]|uniref:Uncharacterized protein n=1 Tax=Candidatus Zambryskibacteria bacterium RIFCSPHIGHO2_02_FULL_43_37 TaxID=1802749 RepID=A0A1G2THF8_9BACT|nr:MAG: hypothetical protein A2723_00835 [Candidatus Zambryskibacteria bacterium RIFCSPHIGHO2_01_FULL_52_18]OHA96745.1 MAG: hypothetical protein A3D49_02795 [Candidatus Zambryskibacteria bacterium RIFCSPHIGHO2_02_FULL_43_37]OHB07438.1 MAG: hypothetical protein A2944_01865 [Candidatus Zambryskibacteria bacterium RIFCSPLOWO2_01_FULL_52_12]OHB11101.1 MAG: hypothetical protein A3J09_00835 [Candidatus Zambryskibacteria bacterium RIFCSPLOWO2_02_FULL_51_21]